MHLPYVPLRSHHVESQAPAHHAPACHAGQNHPAHQWIQGEPQEAKKSSLALCYVDPFFCIGPSLLPIAVAGSTGSPRTGFKNSYKQKNFLYQIIYKI